MFINENRRFGLGQGPMLTPVQREAILVDMDWDGTVLSPEGASIPYLLTKEWFDKTISSAIEDAVLRYEASHLQLTNTPQGE